MDNNTDNGNEILNLLWVEINRAILDSHPVRKALQRLKAAGQLGSVGDYNLVVDMERLIAMSSETGDASPETPEQLVDTSPLKPAPNEMDDREYPEDSGYYEEKTACETSALPAIREFIDGVLLSRNEIRFQGFLESRFDERDWLKKARLRL